MLATKQEILDRYAKREVVSDTLGRIIAVVNLKFSERLAVRRLVETDDSIALAYMSAAAAVRDINGLAFTFPKSLAELNSTIDILDDEGMTSVMGAVLKLGGINESGDDAAKKSQPTPGSSNSAS